MKRNKQHFDHIISIVNIPLTSAIDVSIYANVAQSAMAIEYIDSISKER